MVIKECIVCGKEFDAQRNAKTCGKECSKKNKKQFNKQRYQDNKEYYRQYSKQYYQNNREKILEHDKQYYQSNREKILEYKKQYYQTNREKIKEYDKQRYQDNKERYLQYNRQYHQDNKDELNTKRYKRAMKEIDKLINQYDGDLEKILENIPSRWYLREAQMQVWFNESYYDGMIAKIESTPCCEITGETDDLEIHHLYSFKTHPKLGNKVTNMVRVAKWIHILFHKEYGYGDNTLEQWEEFMDKHNFSYI